MKYKCLSLCVMILIGLRPVVAMEHAEPLEKKLVSKLLVVDQKRIDAHRDSWKNREKARSSGPSFGSYAKIIAGLACVGYSGYTLWYKNQQKPIISYGEKGTKADVRILGLYVKELESRLALTVTAELPTWKQWCIDTLSRSCNVVAESIPFLIKGALVHHLSSSLVSTVVRLFLPKVIREARGSIFRSPTLLLLLEEECKLRLALQNIKMVLQSADALLHEGTLYRGTVIIAINAFVKETEKVVGHMAFVKDLLPHEKKESSYMAEEIIKTVSKILEQVVQATEQFLVASEKPLENRKAFEACYRPFAKAIETSVASILNQMLFFDNVQSAAGLIDVSQRFYSLAREIDSLRSILKPTGLIKSDEKEYLMKNIKVLLVKMGTYPVKGVLKKLIPPFTTV